MTGRPTTGAHHQPSGTRGSYAPRDLYPLPPESILHLEDIPNTSFEVPTFVCLGLFIGSVILFFVSTFYLVSRVFGVVG